MYLTHFTVPWRVAAGTCEIRANPASFIGEGRVDTETHTMRLKAQPVSWMR